MKIFKAIVEMRDGDAYGWRSCNGGLGRNASDSTVNIEQEVQTHVQYIVRCRKHVIASLLALAPLVPVVNWDVDNLAGGLARLGDVD
jgi:hypothetical protein